MDQKFTSSGVMHQKRMLRPFTVADAPQIDLGATIAYQPEQLRIGYCLQGDLEAIAISSISPTPQRRDELWKTTCFEFFLGVIHSPEYWEFNLSATGDWNVYHFQDYRQGMQVESKIATLPFTVEQRENELLVMLALDLSQLELSIHSQSNLQLSVTAVIQHQSSTRQSSTSQSSTCSYWASHHPAQEADFHDRRGFTILLKDWVT
jgi:hypothetical protein